jgi:hypothetical protein
MSEQSSPWQPIETAPTDGTIFLVWCNRPQNRMEAQYRPSLTRKCVCGRPFRQIKTFRSQRSGAIAGLELARETEKDVTEKLAMARTEATSLKDQVTLYVKDREALQVVQASVGSTMAAIEQAHSSSNALGTMLSEDMRRALDQAPATLRSD